MRANARPLTSLPAPTAIASCARIVPENIAFAPTAAAPLTCQNTLDAWAPLVSVTWAPAARLSAPPIWKTKTALGSPPPSSVSVPVSDTAPAAEYRPGGRVRPIKSPAITVPPVRATMSL